MKIRMSIAAAGAAIVLGGTGAFLAPAMASAHSTTHTLKFTSVLSKKTAFSETTVGEADNDLNSAGKIIGFDVLYVSINLKAHTALGNVTHDSSGGLLYGTLKLTSSRVTHGTVTGGTGTFQGATGTILGKSLNKSGTRTAVTITYTT
jgi:hypothetical protein